MFKIYERSELADGFSDMYEKKTPIFSFVIGHNRATIIARPTIGRMITSYFEPDSEDYTIDYNEEAPTKTVIQISLRFINKSYQFLSRVHEVQYSEDNIQTSMSIEVEYNRHNCKNPIIEFQLDNKKHVFFVENSQVNVSQFIKEIYQEFLDYHYIEE